MGHYTLIWLADVLRSSGLEVEELNGWKNRGHGDVGDIRGVICHHTCGLPHGNIDLRILVEGRTDLAGPLCQLGLGRDGTFFCIAAGKAWHAGRGEWQGLTDGNTHFIGIEAENTGQPSDPWPAVQMLSYKRGVAAILKHIGAQPIMCCGHSEYALPEGRKKDPSFDMVKFRADVAALMNQGLTLLGLRVHDSRRTFARAKRCPGGAIQSTRIRADPRGLSAGGCLPGQPRWWVSPVTIPLRASI